MKTELVSKQLAHSFMRLYKRIFFAIGFCAEFGFLLCFVCFARLI